MDKTVIAIGAITILVFGGIIGMAVSQQKNFQPRDLCVQHSNSLGQHIHPELQIIANGQPIAIPANIGIDPNCMKAVHTHDETGKLHIEYPEAEQTFTLGDFFAVWGETFNENQILNYTANDQHKITMTVDGQPSTEFSNLQLKDGQKIVITYE